ncbi:hypothetical protein C8J55DRAFT_565138 [Lentinula edodes]|uniref:Uncharacterized protein n=1 Tax=Lentinula lateritia TaxID=40482 RepID=A0A9W8ZUW8_9AGAR|nr:hypothetical protein C8J55DRAFT_565138 [Lentinula edodes]
MNHTKLNRLAKREYSPASGGSDDDYEPSPSQQVTPAKRRHYDQLLMQHNPSPLPPRSSALAGRSANEDILNSGVLDDDVGSQDFLERLCALRGLDSSILYSEDFKDGASDIDNAEFMPESQKPELYGSSPPPSPSTKLVSVYQINVDEHSIQLVEVKEETSDFCPHSTTACPCAAWLLEQHFQLTKCLALEREENERLVATNFRQRVRLQRTRDALEKTADALDSSQKEAEEARTAQKSMEERLGVANSVRQDVLSWLHSQF